MGYMLAATETTADARPTLSIEEASGPPLSLWLIVIDFTRRP
jgi:hypothetical protein